MWLQAAEKAVTKRMGLEIRKAEGAIDPEGSGIKQEVMEF
jgi:hypothetical protein